MTKEYISACYSLEVFQITPITGLFFSPGYLVRCKQGDYFLKRWYDFFTAADIQLQYRIHNELNNRYFPQLVNTSDGIPYISFNEKKYSLFSYLIHDIVNPLQIPLKACGAALSSVHKSLKRINVLDSPLPTLNLALFEKVDTAVTAFSLPNNQLSDVLRAMSFSYVYTPSHLQLIHGDYSPGNILIRSNQVIGVIDFADTQYGSIFQDLAHLIIYTCFDSNDCLIVEKVDQLLDGYGISNIKYEYLLECIAFELVAQLSSFGPHIDIFVKRTSTRQYLLTLHKRLVSIASSITTY